MALCSMLSVNHYAQNYNIPMKVIFKPGACRPKAGALDFLKLFLCRHLYMCVCVFAPESINN